MKLTIAKDIDDLSNQLAEWIINFIQLKLKNKSRFNLVLAGGETPEKLYRLLASSSYKNRIDWNKLHFFFGDERYVPLDDDRNNAGMVLKTLMNHVPVLPGQVNIIRTDISPDKSAAEYENLLHHLFPEPDHTFDLVLLGLGDDAHTLSLFPGNDLVHEKSGWVKSFFSSDQKMHRITMTAPVVNASDRIAFLVSGGKKAASLYHVLTGEYNPDQYPAQVIQPFNDELYWWVDKAAAADLT